MLRLLLSLVLRRVICLASHHHIATQRYVSFNTHSLSSFPVLFIAQVARLVGLEKLALEFSFTRLV
jgi:hypothetical protein